MASLELDRVTKQYPNGVTAVTELSLAIADGEFMVLVGPSGCGKTTLLRMIAGLESITSGAIRLGARDVTGVEPEDRDMAMVFQNYALYPHMSVRKNLGFGLRLRRTPKAEAQRRIEAVSAALNLSELLGRKPSELSGGQRQRVAVGRAMVREPQAFLMDEPLSNLDAKLRVGMRSELVRLHKRLGVTTVYVTHDQVEAMTLGERVAVMRDGVIQQCDRPQVLFDRPANLFVAGFIGSPPMNLVDAHIADGKAFFAEYSISLPDAARLVALPERVVLGIRPCDFSLVDGGRPGMGETMHVVPDVVEELGAERYLVFPVDVSRRELGRVADTVAELEGDAALLRDDDRVWFTAQVGSREPLAHGVGLELCVDTRWVHVFDPESGRNLLI